MFNATCWFPQQHKYNKWLSVVNHNLSKLSVCSIKCDISCRQRCPASEVTASDVMPKWDCVALRGPWGSLWPARVINDQCQAISQTYGLLWGSTTCRNTSGDASNGLWIYVKPSALCAAPSGWLVDCFSRRACMSVRTSSTSAYVCVD